MNWYIGAIEKYAVFQGRARRKEYWYFTLFNMLPRKEVSAFLAPPVRGANRRNEVTVLKV